MEKIGMGGKAGDTKWFHREFLEGHRQETEKSGWPKEHTHTASKLCPHGHVRSYLGPFL